MFRIASPFFLILIPCLIAFLIYIKIRNKQLQQSLIQFPQDLILIDKNRKNKLKLKTIITIINWLILFLFVFALARPQIGNKTDDVLNQGADIMIALDVSSSMEALDFEPVNRLEAAKKIAIDFVKQRKYDRLGVVLFSGLAFTQSPLTNDIQTITKLLSVATTDSVSVDGTAIGSAIVTASNRLKDSTAKSKVIILITDGSNNIGEIDPVTAADIASKLGIKIYTIGAGSIDGAYYQVMDPNEGIKLVKLSEQELDEDTLKEVADITEGKYFRADNTKMLKNIMEQIDSLEKTDMKDIKFTSYQEIFNKFLLVLLILLVFNICLENIFFRKLI